MKMSQIGQEIILNKMLIIRIIIAFMFLYAFYFALLKRTEHDIRLYVFIDQQIKVAKSLSVINELKVMPVEQSINGLFFTGDIYFINGKSMILIINKPTQSGWLFTNISGGVCHKLFGEGNLKGLLFESRKICY